MIFIFNDTATTDIYTYYHTLSLHDALPISFRSPACWRSSRAAIPRCCGGCGSISATRSSAARYCCGRFIRCCCDGGQWCIRLRSEEHTSELQSLMRISYAVFCLKKKNRYFFSHHSLTFLITPLTITY